MSKLSFSTISAPQRISGSVNRENLFPDSSIHECRAFQEVYVYLCFINFTGNELVKWFRLHIIESFPYHALTNTRSNEFFFSTREPVRSQRSYEKRAGYFFGIRSPFLNNAPLQSRLQLRINFQLLLKPSGSFISRARPISVSDGFDTATFKNFYYARFASVRSTKRKEKGNFRQNKIRLNNERFRFLSKY